MDDKGKETKKDINVQRYNRGDSTEIVNQLLLFSRIFAPRCNLVLAINIMK